jgi:uncharacterized protein (TIGR03382 family)
VSAIDFASSSGEFATSARVDDVGAVFTGYLNVPADGTYTLSLTSDDGSALYVGSTKVVDNDGLHGMTEVSGTIGLKAGPHSLRVEFFENAGGAGLIARWAGPGIAAQAIPAAAFVHLDAAVADTDGDGIDDAWEEAHFGDLSRDGTGDADGDGISDYEEYVQGSDPSVANGGGDADDTTAGGTNMFSCGGPGVAPLAAFLMLALAMLARRTTRKGVQ